MVQGSARDDDDTEKSVATTRDIDMSVETEADAAADDQDAVGTRLLKTRKAFVDEQEKKVEEKRNLYLQVQILNPQPSSTAAKHKHMGASRSTWQLREARTRIGTHTY